MAWWIDFLGAIVSGIGVGWFGRGVHMYRKARRPKTLKQLAREQGIKPIRGIDDFPTADPEVFSAEDLDAWDAAIKEARGHE